MVQKIKTPGLEPDYLNLIPESYIVEKNNSGRLS